MPLVAGRQERPDLAAACGCLQDRTARVRAMLDAGGGLNAVAADASKLSEVLAAMEPSEALSLQAVRGSRHGVPSQVAGIK